MEEKNGIDFGERSFDGGHEIPSGALHDFLQKFN
jgi:hypothetical protein